MSVHLTPDHEQRAVSDRFAKDSVSEAKGKRTAIIMSLAMAVIAVALLALGLLPRLARERSLMAQATSVALPPVVTVARPHLGTPNNALAVPGTLYGLHEALLYARANGYVRRVRADIGSSVRAGDTLADVETPELDRELLQARATVEQTEASTELARATLERWRSMVQRTAATAQEFDEKQAAFSVATANAKAARANVERIGELRRFGSIIAPFSGVVTARNVDVGALVAPGSGTTVRPLFALAQMERMRVLANVPQNAAPNVRVGQTAEISVQELGSATFRGTVTRTSRSLDLATRSLQTEIQLDNRDGRLLPGMFAQVRLTLPRSERAMLIAANTLMVRADGPQVAVVRDDTVRTVKVTLGRDFGTEVEVLSGLTLEDVLIVNPSDAVPAGTAVRVATKPVAKDSSAAR